MDFLGGLAGLFRCLNVTFECLDLQKVGWKNLAENFKTSSDLIYFLKIDPILPKLLPIEGGAIVLAKVVVETQSYNCHSFLVFPQLALQEEHDQCLTSISTIERDNLSI